MLAMAANKNNKKSRCPRTTALYPLSYPDNVIGIKSIIQFN